MKMKMKKIKKSSFFTLPWSGALTSFILQLPSGAIPNPANSLTPFFGWLSKMKWQEEVLAAKKWDEIQAFVSNENCTTI